MPLWCFHQNGSLYQNIPVTHAPKNPNHIDRSELLSICVRNTKKDPAANHIHADPGEILEEMRANKNIEHGQDWVNMIGPEVFLCYAHQVCDVKELKKQQKHNLKFLDEVEKIEADSGAPGIVSAASCSWWRLHTDKLAEETYGQTVAGQKQGGRWACGGCCYKWPGKTKRNSEGRMLVAFDDESEQQAWCAYLDVLPPHGFLG